ncbi:hypothetical protein J3A83DRAFT_4240676 [Scleroderma citrinum]
MMMASEDVVMILHKSWLAMGLVILYLCCILTSDPLGILQCKYQDLAHIIQATADFPNPSIIASYLQLVTLWSHNQPHFNGTVISHQPDMTTISQFCIQCFSWSAETVLNKVSSVWTGAII